MAKLRLNKILARAGLTSRRGADRLIAEGRVAVNGVPVQEPGTLADPEVDVIVVDGRPLGRPEPVAWVLLHKPAGYVTTRHDPAGRPVVTDLVPSPVRLFPVGRLDTDVEGVLLLTNDGPLAHRLLHPRYGLPRVYEVEVAGRLGRHELAEWRRGVALEDGWAAPIEVGWLGLARSMTRLRLTFTEGRKHEVKRYCAALGHPAVRLRRVAFGPIRLGRLPWGTSRPLTPAEVRALRRAVGEAAPAPGPRGGGRGSVGPPRTARGARGAPERNVRPG